MAPPAGIVRNDFYITLLHGEFDRGKKKTPKNVEVILSVHDQEGNPMEVSEVGPSGTGSVRLTQSIVAVEFRYDEVAVVSDHYRWRLLDFKVL